MRARALQVVGITGVVLWVALAVIAWIVLARVGHRLGDAVRTAETAVGGMRGRLDRVDATLAEVADSADALATEARARMRERIQEELAALEDVARGVDALLGVADDVPFLDVGRADPELAGMLGAGILPVLDPDAKDAPAATLRDGVAGARATVARWGERLAGLERDLAGVGYRLRRGVAVAILLVVLLALWAAVGQVCLARRGREGLKRA